MIVKTPSRAKETLLAMIENTPILAVLLLPKYRCSPTAKNKFSKPPRTTALLNKTACSPTPSSLKAFASHLNHEERTVADKVIANGRVDPRISQVPAIRRSIQLLLFPLCEGTAEPLMWRAHRLLSLVRRMVAAIANSTIMALASVRNAMFWFPLCFTAIPDSAQAITNP